MANATISSVAEFINVLNAAHARGRFVTIDARSAVKLNKFNTDGAPKERIAEGFAPYRIFSVTFNFGADYERAMSKALGTDFQKETNTNRETIIKDVLMRYVSTGNYCLIYLNGNYKPLGVENNGKALTDEETAYMERFMPKGNNKGEAVKYRNVSLKNITRIAIDGEVYNVSFEETKAAA